MRASPLLLATAERVSRVRMSAVLTALLAAGALANPEQPLPIDLCVLKALTGWSCPTCGLTRAVCHALQGEWAASVAFHPAGILVAASLLSWASWAAIEAARGRVLWRPGQRLLSILAGALIGAVSLMSWLF